MLTERQRLDALYKISRILREQEADLQNILQTALTASAEAIGAKHGCLITFHKDDRTNNKLILGPQGNLEGRYALWQELISRGLIGMVHHGRRVIVIYDIGTDQRWPQLTTTPDELRSGSAIGLPLEKMATCTVYWRSFIRKSITSTAQPSNGSRPLWTSSVPRSATRSR